MDIHVVSVNFRSSLDGEAYVVGVYASLEKAKAYCAETKLATGYFDIETFDLIA